MTFIAINSKVTDINNRCFSGYDVTLKRRLTFKYPNCLLIYEGDVVSGMAEILEGSSIDSPLTFKSTPLIELGTDKITLLAIFTKIIGATKAPLLYDKLVLLAIDDKEIKESSTEQSYKCSQYLNKVVDRWINHRYSIDSSIVQILKSKLDRLSIWWYQHRNLRCLHNLGLDNQDITNSQYNTIQLYSKCLTNPFTIYTLSMTKSVRIFNLLGKQYTDTQEEEANIVRTIHQNLTDKQWVGTPINNLLSIYPTISHHINTLIREYNIMGKYNTVYLDYSYRVETELGRIISTYLQRKMEYNITNLEWKDQALTSQQQKTISNVLNLPISIVTGGAGTGKTTIITELLYQLEKANIVPMITSFTGKAIARIKQVIKRQFPLTIHMLLSVKRKINFQCLIVDEVSMVTTDLFLKLGQRYQWKFNIILIGDPNQLPPITWGTLFDQLIKSAKIPIFTLTENFRSASNKNDGIIENAGRLVNYVKLLNQQQMNQPITGDISEPFQFKSSTNFILSGGDDNTVCNMVRALFRKGIKSTWLTIITPYNMYLKQLNTNVSMIYNGNNQYINDIWRNKWTLNDRVMLLKNCYDINTMNGEEGIIVDITTNGISVDFGNLNIQQFSTSDVGKNKKTTQLLTVSYAVSVHKSQGSEWDFVIFYLPVRMGSSGFLNANLIYTAITRAKRMIWCIGDIDKLNEMAIRPLSYRCENLYQMIT